MFRILILLCAFGHFACIKAENDLISTPSEQKIQDEIFKIISSQTQAFWKVTPSDQNIQFPPLSLEAGMQMLQMKIYHESFIGVFYSKDQFLGTSYALASYLDNISQGSSGQVKFINTVFYDQRNTSKQLLSELKTYYHAEAYETSFDSNSAVLNLINEWLSNVTKGRSPKVESFPTTGMTNLQSSLISFTSCWDTPKTSANFIKVLRFKNSNGEFDIETFNSKETVGYYKNAEQKYEAIRLPFKKGEFAMVVVLPNPDQTLESIGKFSVNDHRQLLQRVGENNENIDFAIPFMNLTQMTVNENGAVINGDDTNICNWPKAQETQEINKIDYKPFYVNRPFALYVYDEKTKFVLMYGLVNNPALGTMQFRTFRGKLTSTKDNTDLQFER